MAISTVTTYKTSDGKVFEAEGEARRHEAVLLATASLTEFLDRSDLEGRARTRARNIIVAWEEFCVIRDSDAREAKVATGTVHSIPIDTPVV